MTSSITEDIAITSFLTFFLALASSAAFFAAAADSSSLSSSPNKSSNPSSSFFYSFLTSTGFLMAPKGNIYSSHILICPAAFTTSGYEMKLLNHFDRSFTSYLKFESKDS